MDSVELARKIRKDCLVLTTKNKAGHIGSLLSLADILAVLFVETNICSLGERDRFVLSKGHGLLAAVSAAKNMGANISLGSVYKFGGRVLKEGERFNKFPFIDYYSASLGHGICVAVGLALAAKLDGKPGRVFVVVGNGECSEGTIWESLLVASHHKLSNLVIIVDNNHMQAMGNSKRILNLGSLRQKFRAFGAKVLTIDGHDHAAIRAALKGDSANEPLVIVANTIKGKGVSFAENNAFFHYGYVKKRLLARALFEVQR